MRKNEVLHNNIAYYSDILAVLNQLHCVEVKGPATPPTRPLKVRQKRIKAQDLRTEEKANFLILYSRRRLS